MLIEPADGAAVRSRAWRRGALPLAALGALSAACWIITTWEKEVGHRRAYAAGDLERLRTAAVRLRLLGRDGPRLHVSLGRLEERRGRADVALSEYRASLALEPTAAAWAGVGRTLRARGELGAARDAFTAALALEPERASARRGLDEVVRALSPSYEAPLDLR